MRENLEQDLVILRKIMSRRKFLAGATAATLGGVLAACGVRPDGTQIPAAESTLEATYTSTTSKGKGPGSSRALIFLSAEAFAAFDPYNHASSATAQCQVNCYDTLWNFDTKGGWIPRLGTAYKFIPDGIEINLRRGVKFHEGQSLTSADVKASVERFSDKQWAHGGFYPEQIAVNVVDEYTVQLITKYPLTVFNTLTNSPIVSVEDVNNLDKLNQKQNGTGPFRWEKYENETIYYSAYQDHWEGKPLLSEFRMSYVGDPSTRLAALQRGEAHIIERVPGEDVPTIESDPNLWIIKVKLAEIIYLAFKMNTQYMKNKALRDAIAYCVDQEGIVNHIMGGNATVPIGYLAAVTWPFNVESKTMPHFDLDKAKQKLVEAGYPDGKNLPELLAVATTGMYPNMKEYVEYIAATCAQIGIKIKIEMKETAAWYDALVTPDSCDLCFHGASGGLDPDMLLRLLWCSPGLTTQYSDPKLDTLINNAAEAKNVDERALLYRGEVNQALSDINSLHPIHETILIAAAQKAVKNLDYMPYSLFPPLLQVYLEE